MKKYLFGLFFVLLIFDCTLIAIGNHDYRIFVKPLLMPVLALTYVLSTNKSSIYFVLALFFSFGGDLLLLYPDFFIFGLVSFLLTHVFYIFIIYKFKHRSGLLYELKNVVPFLAYLCVILYLTYDKLSVKNMVPPVIVYGIVIAMFGTISLVNYLKDKTDTNKLLFVGAVLFIISDSFIALNKFYVQSVVLRIFVMVFYGVSQYFITNVMIKKDLKNE